MNIFYYYGQSRHSSSQYSEQVNSPLIPALLIITNYSKNAESMISDVFQGVQHMVITLITLIFVSQCVNCQSSKKVLSVSLGQVDFLAGHVTFKDYLPNWQGPRQIIQGGVWGRVE